MGQARTALVDVPDGELGGDVESLAGDRVDPQPAGVLRSAAEAVLVVGAEPGAGGGRLGARGGSTASGGGVVGDGGSAGAGRSAGAVGVVEPVTGPQPTQG